MKRYLTPLFMLSAVFVFAQQTADALAVQQTIEKFFEGFHKGDTLMMKKTLYPGLVMQTAYKNQQGKDMLNQGDSAKFLKAIATRPPDQKWEERLKGFHIKVDGNMAHAWTPYEFWFNGQLSHCGVNSFQLFHDAGTWKIIYLVDSRRRKTCGE